MTKRIFLRLHPGAFNQPPHVPVLEDFEREYRGIVVEQNQAAQSLLKALSSNANSQVYSPALITVLRGCMATAQAHIAQYQPANEYALNGFNVLQTLC